jgi:glyoxylase-like metal-dependent hydrolase (beta-lactamase superfamily II)
MQPISTLNVSSTGWRCMRSPGAEMILDGGCDHFIEGARVLFTPGRTHGHCVLLWEDRYLFTGDYFAWLPAHDRFGSFRDACWYSWEEQIESVEKLKICKDVEWVFPSHGKWERWLRESFQRSLTKPHTRCERAHAEIRADRDHGICTGSKCSRIGDSTSVSLV